MTTRHQIITKPMLASSVKDISKLKFPLIATPKIDGIRCLKIDGQLVSRKFKPIRNKYIQETLVPICPDGLDGELVVGKTFQACTSAIMSVDGTPDFTFHVFDYVLSSLTKPYITRLYDLFRTIKQINSPFVQAVPTQTINNIEELNMFEEECLAVGFEGIMLRVPQGPYKCGRATLKEGWLLKLKQFEDSEATIIGFEEQMHNLNDPTIDDLGYTQRSSVQDGMTPAGTLGTILARDDKRFPDITLRIGTGEGLTYELRQEIWNNQAAYIGRIISYKYQDVGSKDAPRFPTWRGFRDPDDL